MPNTRELPYDLEEFNDNVALIRAKRGYTYSQLSAFWGVSVSHLYRVRKGTRTSQPLFDKVEQTYNELYERYYFIAIEIINDYYYVRYSVHRSFKGALRRQMIYENNRHIKDSLISAEPFIIKRKLMEWLHEYRIENKEFVVGLINFRLGSREAGED